MIADSKARQVYLALRERILSGAVLVGTRLPSEPEMARDHGVSRVTIRRALAELLQEGLIDRRPGAGTRVRAQGQTPGLVADIGDLVARIAEMGQRTEARLLSFAYVQAPDAMAAAMRLPRQTRLQRSVRVRHVDGAPFSYLTAHVPESIGQTFTDQELATRPLLALMERSGVRVERAQQTVRATLAMPDVATALDIALGSPLLEVERIVFDRDGRGVEHLHALYRPDRYALSMDMLRTGGPDQRVWSPVTPQSTHGQTPVNGAARTGPHTPTAHQH